MPDPLDPNVTAPTPPADAHASAASDRDETAGGRAAPGVPTASGFGPPVAPGEVGTLGPFRVVKRLGAGGMGAVYLAVDTRLDRKLALKVMLPEFAADTAAKERFLREAKAAAKISHDNVVTVYEADERGGVPYIAMQFLQGYPLDDYLKNKGALPMVHVIRIAREAALGLAAAHALGLVHRDIKPANLWLETPGGRVKVLDFGLAKPIGAESELTKSGAVLGTPSYMSPEQARGQKVDHRTDLFSLGAVLYRLVTGQNPFAGEHVMAVLAAVLTDDPAPVRELNPAVPEPLAQLIHQSLAKKPEQRPQTAAEVTKRLRVILDQMLNPGAPVASGSVPATGAELSGSLPVVVNPIPRQPPVVVPMQVTAHTESAFADIDAEGDSTDTAPAAPRPERKRGKGLLIAASVAVLLAVVAGAAVVLQRGGKKEPAPDAGAAAVAKENPAPKGPSEPLPPTFKNSIGMEFVKVPKGTGWLGGGGGKPGETKVVFDQDYYLGRYEVTQEQWEVVMGQNPSAFTHTGASSGAVKGVAAADLKRFPVESVSWSACQLFVERLNRGEKGRGWVYRLPTGAEWEYACRGGPIEKEDSAFDFYLAKPLYDLLPDQANVDSPGAVKRACKVGSYKPNALSLYDMHGNVVEWCDDTVTAPDGASHRVIRGGMWALSAINSRAGNQSTHPPGFAYPSLGLRVARVPSAPAGKSAADPDRAAAEWVISQGGCVRVNNEGTNRGVAVELPRDRFTLNGVDLTGTKVSDAGLAQLKGLKNLTAINLSATPVSDQGLTHFRELKGLTYLHLNNTAVSDAGLAHLKELKNLTDLSLGDTVASDAGLVHLRELNALTSVALGGTRVSDAGLVHLKGIKGLTGLYLGGTKVSDVGLEHLKEIEALTALHLNSTQVSDAGFAHLKALKNLTQLDVRKTPVTAKGLEAFHAALPGCKIEHDGGTIEPKK